jgi:uncharacterized protein (UPF0179 family)
MKQLMGYIGYIMGILGFAGVVWTYATKSAGKDYDIAELKEDIETIQECMISQNEFREIKDSIDLYNYRVEGKLNELIQSQNALRRSYISYLKHDSSLTKDDFIELMNGIEWIITPPRVDSSDFKIKIRKINKQ